MYLEYTVIEGENPVCRLDPDAYGALFRVAYFGNGALNGR